MPTKKPRSYPCPVCGAISTSGGGKHPCSSSCMQRLRESEGMRGGTRRLLCMWWREGADIRELSDLTRWPGEMIREVLLMAVEDGTFWRARSALWPLSERRMRAVCQRDEEVQNGLADFQAGRQRFVG